MSVFISLLRGINVGGQKKITMEGLRALYTRLGFTAVQTYVQSGNVVFQADQEDGTKLAKQIEAQIREVYGFEVAVFIRLPEDFQRILGNNPFLTGRQEDPTRLHVTFFYQPPTQAAWEKAIAPDGIPDEFKRGESEVYLFFPNGSGKTKLSNDFFERKLGVRATTRNWNTVNALYGMAKDTSHESR